MLRALARKEFLILRRDIHALASLFLMPALFIVIMSLALKDIYNPPVNQLAYAIEQQDKGELAQEFVARWTSARGKPQKVPGDVDDALRSGRLRYLIRIEPDFSKTVAAPGSPQSVQVRLVTDPDLNISLYRSTEAELAALVGELRAEALQERFTGLSRKGGQSIGLLVEARRFDVGFHPTAVQQNVPAWLIFGMFFVVNAIASLLVQEHDNGTLSRLLTLGIGPLRQLASKGLPYLLVNALQVVLMLAIGIWGMPLLGSDGLVLAGVHWEALILILAAISGAAVSMALALASVIRTHAQASTIGPILNVLMAALGGIMVPRFVMPAFMQTIAGYSPMNWSLEGLLAVVVRHAPVQEILPHVARLGIFALIMLVAAVLLFKRRIRS